MGMAGDETMIENRRRRIGVVVAVIAAMVIILFAVMNDAEEAMPANDTDVQRHEAEQQQNSETEPQHHDAGQQQNNETEPQHHEADAPVIDRMIFEAEDAVLKGTVKEHSAQGFSGTGYVSGFDEDGDHVQFHVSVPVSGLYQLAIGFRAPYGDKNFNLSVNGKSNGEVSMKETDQFSEISAGKLLLAQGENTITIHKGWGWYEIDYISVESAQKRAAHQVTEQLVNPNAAPEARRLMRYLVDQYGKAMIAGQQEFSNLAWLENNIGKKPAMIGFDLMDYSPSRVEHGAKSMEVDKAIIWHKAGGIVTFVWHWNAPKDLINTSGQEWWRGFYADATDFDVAYAMEHPDSEDYQLLVRDIDVIAEQLKKLQEAEVPVLFRPLHEAEGGWFWWGAKGPEPAKALYRLVYDRITNHHQIHNLIWVWNSIDQAWYPGDEIVDIVSMDSYPPEGDYSPISDAYEKLTALVQDRKLVAMTENGAIPDPDLLQQYGAHWSWFCTWDGHFLKDGKHNDIEHLTYVYHHPYVITLDELPDLRTYGD